MQIPILRRCERKQYKTKNTITAIGWRSAGRCQPPLLIYASPNSLRTPPSRRWSFAMVRGYMCANAGCVMAYMCMPTDDTTLRNVVVEVSLGCKKWPPIGVQINPGRSMHEAPRRSCDQVKKYEYISENGVSRDAFVMSIAAVYRRRLIVNSVRPEPPLQAAMG